MPQTTLDGLDLEELENNTIKTFTKIKERVRYILEKYPQTTGHDNILHMRYFSTFPCGVKISFKDFDALIKAPRMETIRRARQLIQEREKGLEQIYPNYISPLLPTDKTIRKRRNMEMIMENLIVSGMI